MFLSIVKMSNAAVPGSEGRVGAGSGGVDEIVLSPPESWVAAGDPHEAVSGYLTPNINELCSVVSALPHTGDSKLRRSTGALPGYHDSSGEDNIGSLKKLRGTGRHTHAR